MLHEELALVRMELHTEMAELRDELRTEFNTGLGRLDQRIDKLDGKVDALAGSVSRDLREQLRWLVGTQIAVLAIMVALAALVVTLVS